jgi:PAS domain S-box-containing protein
MDYKKKYEELKETNRQLEKELETLRSKIEEKDGIARDMIFKAFHSASQLMAISSFDSGKYVDVNNAFLSTLGYNKEELIGNTPDDIGLFTDLDESNKYLRLLSRFDNIKDYAVTLRTKTGEDRSFLFSAEKVFLVNEVYLLTIYNDISILKDKRIRDSQGSVLEEIFETVSSYLALFSFSEDNRFYIIDINSKVEEIEFVSKSEILGKCIDNTPLANRSKLLELLHHVRITGEAHKLAASPSGDDSEGFYMGFILTSGNILITWEPGHIQRKRDDISRQVHIFEKFADMLPEMVYEVDLSGKIVFANKISLEFLGYSKEDLIKGIHISEIFPENYEQMIQKLRELTAPGQVTSNEYTAKKKDGSLVPILTYTFATYHNDKITGYRGVVTDISHQKKYEDQIKREKAFLEHLIDSIPEAICLIDLGGKITMINREFTSLFGYTAEEALGKDIDDLVVPEDLKNDAIHVSSSTSQSNTEIRQTIRKDKYGNKFDVSVIATSITLNNEIIANLGIYRNISVEKKNQLLQEILYNISSVALNQFDIENIYPAIVNELNKIWDTNNFFIALYDKTNDMLSLPFFADEKDKFYEIPAKNTITAWVINHNKSVLLKEQDLKVLEDNGEIDLVGTPCKVWMGVPLKADEEIIGAICLQDYHNENKFSQEDVYLLEFIANQIAIAIQRRTMLDNLILASQKAEEAAQSKQQFMSTMSHEIRTPLNEVIGITNLLLQGNPREDQMDYIKTLRFSGNHLLALVNDVLDYNKMESGKIVFEETLFNLSDFLNNIMRSYSFRSRAKNLGFEIIKEGDLPLNVIGDPIRLNQILSNLLSNALKFTREGNISVTIRELERSGNQSKLEFIIKDTGIGIPKERQRLIFDSFTQASADTTRYFGGTGLGLAICKKLVDLQGGEISVDSEPGKGSTFRFFLSFDIAEEKSPQVQPPERSDDYSGLEGKRILVAEDNKINFFVTNKFLIGWGMIVTHAENGRIALEMLEREEFDLIIMDLHMPVMDGIEATRIIRKSDNPAIRDIPIVALTAAIMSESHDKIDDLNINDYVLKPFKPRDLFDKISKHIR